MNRTIRLFIFLEAVAFGAAALTHFGILVNGYRHRPAANAESVISIVLFAGWLCTLIRPGWTRRVDLLVQAFALFGTLVGIFTIAVGIGPRTIPDLLYHACIVIVLVFGLTFAFRAKAK